MDSTDSKPAAKEKKFPPLEQVTKPNLETSEFAHYSNVRAQTWRVKHCRGTLPDELPRPKGRSLESKDFRARLKQGKRYLTRYVSNRSSRRTSRCFLSLLLCKAWIMQTKGKGSKVFVDTRNGRSRLLTFPRGDWSQDQRNKARKGRRI